MKFLKAAYGKLINVNHIISISSIGVATLTDGSEVQLSRDAIGRYVIADPFADTTY